MTDHVLYVSPSLTLVCLPPDGPVLFSLEATAELTGIHPELLRYYGRLGLIGPAATDRHRQPLFDDEALREIRRLEHYRRHLHVPRRALPLLCALRRAGERQHIELSFLTRISES